MIVYKITNNINGKIYIGQTCRKDHQSYFGSGTTMQRALNKYGKENFTKDILEHCVSIDHMNDREIYFIEYYNSTNPKIGYNISAGGNGNSKMRWVNNSISERFIRGNEKIPKGFTKGRLYNENWEKAKRHPQTKETRLRISRSCTGRKLSDEHKLNISLSQLGKNRPKAGKKLIYLNKQYKSVKDLWSAAFTDITYDGFLYRCNNNKIQLQWL